MRIKKKREKTKTSLWNRQGNEEPIFPTKHWEKSACQRKQHGSLTHSKSKTNQNLLMKMKCIFPIPMNKIYGEEQEVSSKENKVKSNARNINSLWLQKENNNQSDYRIYNSWPLLAVSEHFFFKNTLHLHQKVSQKHTKITIQSWNRSYLAPRRWSYWQAVLRHNRSFLTGFR